jgi:hypothetical protein
MARRILRTIARRQKISVELNEIQMPGVLDQRGRRGFLIEPSRRRKNLDRF